MAIALLALLALVIFIAVENSDSSNSKDECIGAHESYGMRSGPELRKYSKFAVAVDNKECSAVGKLVNSLKNVMLS